MAANTGWSDQPMLVMDGGLDGEELVPVGPVTSMGRQPGNDVVVAEAGVSRRHAEIVSSDEGYLLRDLESTNGTFVNEERLESSNYLLKDGDEIRLGASKQSISFRHSSANTIQITLVQPAITPEALEETMEAEQGPPAATVDESEASPTEESLEEFYEGTVRLNVHVEGNMGLVVNFVQQVRERPDLRLLRLTNNRKGGVDVWIALREPVPLRQVINDMDGVSGVGIPAGRDLSPGSEDSPLTVHLKLEALTEESAPSWALCVKCKEALEPGTTVCPSCGATQT